MVSRKNLFTKGKLCLSSELEVPGEGGRIPNFSGHC